MYDEYHKKIYDFVKRRVTNHEVSEDLTSEIFEKILKNIDDFQWQGITVSAWIFRIARNHIIDYYRKENKHKGDKSLDDVAHFIESQSPTVDAELEHKESEKSLYLAMQQLKEEEQYMIFYKFYEDLPNKDVAQILGMSETNVGTKLHRLKKKLEEIIHKQENSNK